MIPQIVDVVLDKRPKTAKPYQFPTKCPACGSHAVREDGRGGAPLHRRADLPGAAGRAAAAFRVARAPSTSRGWARSRSRRSTTRAWSWSRPTSSRCGRATRAPPRSSPSARATARPRCATCSTRSTRGATISLDRAHLRARHPPRRRDQRAAAGAPLRHHRGVARRR